MARGKRSSQKGGAKKAGRGSRGSHSSASSGSGQSSKSSDPAGPALHLRLIAEPEFYEAVGDRGTHVSEQDLEDDLPGLGLKLDRWHNLEKLVSWFKEGLAADPQAQLLFSQLLTEEQRVQLDKVATAGGVHARNPGDGSIALLSKASEEHNSQAAQQLTVQQQSSSADLAKSAQHSPPGTPPGSDMRLPFPAEPLSAQETPESRASLPGQAETRLDDQNAGGVSTSDDQPAVSSTDSGDAVETHGAQAPEGLSNASASTSHATDTAEERPVPGDGTAEAESASSSQSDSAEAQHTEDGSVTHAKPAALPGMPAAASGGISEGDLQEHAPHASSRGGSEAAREEAEQQDWVEEFVANGEQAVSCTAPREGEGVIQASTSSSTQEYAPGAGDVTERSNSLAAAGTEDEPTCSVPGELQGGPAEVISDEQCPVENGRHATAASSEAAVEEKAPFREMPSPAATEHSQEAAHLHPPAEADNRATPVPLNGPAEVDSSASTSSDVLLQPPLVDEVAAAAESAVHLPPEAAGVTASVSCGVDAELLASDASDQVPAAPVSAPEVVPEPSVADSESSERATEQQPAELHAEEANAEQQPTNLHAEEADAEQQPGKPEAEAAETDAAAVASGVADAAAAEAGEKPCGADSRVQEAASSTPGGSMPAQPGVPTAASAPGAAVPKAGNWERDEGDAAEGGSPAAAVAVDLNVAGDDVSTRLSVVTFHHDYATSSVGADVGTATDYAVSDFGSKWDDEGAEELEQDEEEGAAVREAGSVAGSDVGAEQQEGRQQEGCPTPEETLLSPPNSPTADATASGSDVARPQMEAAALRRRLSYVSLQDAEQEAGSNDRPGSAPGALSGPSPDGAAKEERGLAGHAEVLAMNGVQAGKPSEANGQQAKEPAGTSQVYDHSSPAHRAIFGGRECSREIEPAEGVHTRVSETGSDVSAASSYVGRAMKAELVAWAKENQSLVLYGVGAVAAATAASVLLLRRWVRS